jgi:hypothetical protein
VTHAVPTSPPFLAIITTITIYYTRQCSDICVPQQQHDRSIQLAAPVSQLEREAQSPQLSVGNALDIVHAYQIRIHSFAVALASLYISVEVFHAFARTAHGVSSYIHA